jgi:signal transduction histidine kinase
MPHYHPLHAYYGLIPILVRSFCAIAFVFLSVYCLRESRTRKKRWGGNAYVSFVVAYAILYVDMLAEEWAGYSLGHSVMLLDAIDGVTTLMLPALVFHVFYQAELEYLSLRWMWRIWLLVIYAMSLTGAFLAVAWELGAIHVQPRLFLANLVFIPPAFLAVTGGIAVTCASRRSQQGSYERNQRNRILIVFGAWGCVVLVWRLLGNDTWIVPIKDACPLAFVFVVTYYVERYAFFDVLIKKAAFIFTSLFLLTMYMTFATPWLWSLPLRGWIGTLIWGISVWPIVLLAPWGQSKLSAWLDRNWLGRRFLPGQASNYFLTGLQNANSESELIQRATELLRKIFQSESDVLLGASTVLFEKEAGGFMQAPIRLHGERAGLIRIQQRAHNPRFLSEDIELLASLAETFSFLLENLRLREQHLRQEKREHELLLETNRAELRALRAQVNPHFMFNALNTIAGLIPRRPERAEETIEQLAEVFRHTLRRSEREWVRLHEELEAVRAYLAIEQTRFGDRLQFSVVAGEGTESVRIPAMIVQTLVENAVKHGVGAIRAPGRIDVNATVSAERLQIEVRDNGPGFEESAMRSFHRSGGGHGLRNIRERLRGYFGDAARLDIGRDATLGITVVNVEMPRTAQAAEVAP